jgi:moderate conductance mechanosensitive channel
MDVTISDIITDFFASQSNSTRLVQIMIVISIAILLLYLFNQLVARITPRLAQRTDRITTTQNVLRLRRAETLIDLGITAVRVLLIMVTLLVIWNILSGGTLSLALIGVGTVAVVLASATIVPILRDITYGFIMIVERWYGIGDHIVIEPFTGSGGIVEKLTLRSTKLRSVNGETIWWNNQYIQGVRVTSAASHPLVVETFVNDPEIGTKVVEEAIKIIPSSSTTISQPLAISEVALVSDNVWRVTAICEITPFREWIMDDFAVDVIKETDKRLNEKPVIVHGPVVYYADATAQKRYQRSAAARQRIRPGLKR